MDSATQAELSISAAKPFAQAMFILYIFSAFVYVAFCPWKHRDWR